MWTTAIGLLPFLALLLTILSYGGDADHPSEGVSRGALVWGAFLIFFTYAFSFFSALSREFILAGWLGYAVFPIHRLWHGGWRWPRLAKPSWQHYVIAAILFLTLVTGLIYPPNNMDSMAYHMPRVMHWLQNQGVQPYFTHIARQIEFSPFAEMTILHSQALADSDIFANMSQWLAFAGAICLVGALARQLGGSASARDAAMIFMATLPMGILQASSTQNDLVATFWLLCAAHRYWRWRDDATLANSAWLGLAVGLAIATKGTGFVFCFPWVAAFACRSCARPRALLLKAVAAGVLSLAVFAPHFLLLRGGTGRAFGEESSKTMVARPTFARFMVIALANLLSNNIVRPGLMEDVHQELATGLGIPNGDPETYFGGGRLYFTGLKTFEDNAQNYLHLPLALAAAYAAIRHAGAARRHSLLLMATAGIFCAFIKWQPWITRLQLPLFALAAPLFGLLLEKMRVKELAWLIAASLLIGSSLPLADNQIRPLFPRIRISPGRIELGEFAWPSQREKLYSNLKNAAFYANYAKQLDLLAAEKPQLVGLLASDAFFWEYPLWPMLRARLGYAPEIRHIPVPPRAPASRRFENPPWGGGEWPDFLFVLGGELPWEAEGAGSSILPRAYAMRNGKYVRLDEL